MSLSRLFGGFGIHFEIFFSVLSPDSKTSFIILAFSRRFNLGAQEKYIEQKRIKRIRFHGILGSKLQIKNVLA